MQSHYNEFRVHGSLDGRTPWQVWYERARLTPLFEEVEALYDESVERINQAGQEGALGQRNSHCAG